MGLARSSGRCGLRWRGVTDLQSVMSLRRFGVECASGGGQAAVDQVWPVLDLAKAAADGGDEVVGVKERRVGQFASQQRPDHLDRVEVGTAGGQLVDGEPLVRGDELSHPLGQMGVQIVPDQYDRAVELRVRGDDQVAVVASGEALTPVRSLIRGRPVDQPGSLAQLVAGQGSDRQASSRPAAYPDDRGVPAARPGSGGRRRHREPGFVLEDEPGPERRRRSSAAGQVSFTHAAVAASSRSSARRAGT
jgi:hypothetical protein